MSRWCCWRCDEYLHPLAKHGIDVLVLGCTHYPILRNSIQVLLGPDVAVIDSAEQCDTGRFATSEIRLLKTGRSVERAIWGWYFFRLDQMLRH